MAKKWKINTLVSLFFGVTFAYFMWLLWKKITQIIGDSWIVLLVLGGILFIGMLGGWFGSNKILDKFGVE